ncbi:MULTISPECIES: prolyl oligopeptidase family serine peptidase [Thermomonospora]|uniref:prolyl oligopeptidase n=1 Tax=Thermomonospora curvata (strain ATCC 19995 / DSM 43183 / JCM 3096 / KCTC 9072 / NBRC 15933 / NCIMB 10081 / Henssen B9) TaxID=471852 RepID=D1A9Y5_THECD|nr:MULTISPECIES: prolyl oligopeptidase family serine peptidase [Thermomonospora]ACY96921.1 Prolyl oligopeptidase [Thermomonospora curvata DSM 43183]PKK15201.1 MAG: S9 family peptidase [Thermomonospora sp. CIF 1]
MSRPRYPSAPRQDIVDELHGHRIPDPYRWLEDPDSPATKQWLAEQDELFRSAAGALPGRRRLRDRIAELLRAGSVGPPVWRGERRFFTRRTADQEHAVLYTADPDGREQVLIDPMQIDPSGVTTLDGWSPDREGRLLAYLLSHGGDEESRLYVMDVVTGEVLEGPIERTRYTPIAWLPSRLGEPAAFYYVRRLPPGQVPEGEEQYHRRVYLHRVGTDPDTEDVLIFGEGMDKTNYYGVSVSRDGRWLTVSASQGTAPRTDVWLADLAASSPQAPRLTPVQVGVDAQTSLHVGRDGRAYLFTDRDAPRGRLCVADPADPSHESWRELIPEDPEAVLTDYAILDGPALARPLLLAGWTRHAVSEITVHDLATGKLIEQVPLPGLGSIGALVERPEGGHEAWFVYTDNTTPTSVYRYDALTGRTALWAGAPGKVEVPEVETRQITYESYDGTKVRMLVIARPGGHGPRPTVLYGYGGFNVSLTPSYSAGVLAWAEAGGVYAIANLRGGSEEGEEWHRAGMREHKQNVFDDFHAAAEKLIADGWTTPQMLGISGGSNGGLLVGAAITQRPDLYAAAVCSAPLLDMVRYEKFGLGQTWNDEYGSAEIPEELEWLLSYSPYHHVREGVAYPAVLFTVFDGDTRVDPLHARKMCAALQHATASDRPVLLRHEAEVGHGGRAVSRSVELSADTLSFLAAHTGLQLTDEPEQ